MDKRIAVVGIILDDISMAQEVNKILHMHSSVIVGRMGIPYREKGISVISIIVDGTMDELSSLTGKLGRIPGVSVKSAVSKKA
ncbi:putative iron-only hydrogenase system regulator [Clostridium acetobutylicum]|uniref:Uncharacterized protein, ortholog of Thermotoga maritima (4981823) n=1 Tax=Clostridium acetobutylicum (strain ATCC 824 / DSM 792 / JCM 1419 / IAM 19013 / LMG 5710 / NBRC 13948 / NRRL B-527 / VKM B-1787 / 2291 / W) TaxID=272562 RepID=Q97LR7_CLOAB|nr:MULTISPECIES: TM1266 family iron-only hydrogenase system putative regulator [Clostridium]AAK78467.1 Uncharacterized protein, ortholog of Thermotoga maritima (4981823) [Clostridium acetobutylicum ATCC 824]ADZ19537.1 Conserved hypothetical protein [Clostridium acetobutylicum EA 2018]AEI31270.1 hypothetical protein SMB_G0497 [Clostridium acetobutylicum DSM 1731]AWV80189.1 CopG family transcriptional regulator [Clostridium acetobutylicum]KHD37739.1 CopG family transcripitonal regulator [Clostri